MFHLCESYPGIFITTEEKARENPQSHITVDRNRAKCRCSVHVAGATRHHPHSYIQVDFVCGTCWTPQLDTPLESFLGCREGYVPKWRDNIQLWDRFCMRRKPRVVARLHDKITTTRYAIEPREMVDNQNSIHAIWIVDWSQGMLAVIWCRIFCLPVCHTKIQRLRYTEL
jgi:hypothetical protein